LLSEGVNRTYDYIDEEVSEIIQDRAEEASEEDYEYEIEEDEEFDYAFSSNNRARISEEIEGGERSSRTLLGTSQILPAGKNNAENDNQELAEFLKTCIPELNSVTCGKDNGIIFGLSDCDRDEIEDGLCNSKNQKLSFEKSCDLPPCRDNIDIDIDIQQTTVFENDVFTRFQNIINNHGLFPDKRVAKNKLIEGILSVNLVTDRHGCIEKHDHHFFSFIESLEN